MKLDIPENLNAPPVIRSLVKSLSQRFEPTQARYLEKAIELGCCIQILSDRADFVRFMESFIYEVPYNSNSYSWGYKCDGLSLLAYDADMHGDDALKSKAIAIIASKNFDENDLDWLVDNARDELDFDREEIEGREILRRAGKELDLTPKEIQQGCCSKIVQFTYYHQLLKAYKAESAAHEIERFTDLVERERTELKALLTGL